MAWAPPSRRPSDWHGKANRDSSGRVLSATARGYGYHWDELRAGILAKYPVCIDCDRRGMTQAVDECHHVIPIRVAPERRLDVTNVAPLCESCHDRWERCGPPTWWPEWIRQVHG